MEAERSDFDIMLHATDFVPQQRLDWSHLGLEDCGHALKGDIYSTLIFIIFIVFFWRLACKM
ncbi:hypothetical protein QG37_00411 [Candidozyma auris]|nr:hypothetical protein QG37_00411 [[Candida] auris]